MEETISLVLHGCELAKDLEQNLQNYNVSPNRQHPQPDMLVKSCNEISRIFASAAERLASLFPQISRELQEPSARVNQSDPSLQEWLIRRGVTQAMDMIQQQILGGRVVGSSSAFEMSEAVGARVQAVAASDSGTVSPAAMTSSQRVRRRKDEGDKRKIRARAPPGGNMELPPDDNYTWRKYGQKEILGSIYPRAYYRCTHQKLYNCPAKKQVQRLDSDFHTFEVTYIGDHTCHMSATAPSIPPPPEPAQDLTQTMASHQPQPTSLPMGRWLSMDFGFGAGGNAGSSSSTTTMGGGTGSGAGPSTSRYGKDVDYPAVADMADVMFNSGSSSTNSMDFIFPSVDDKWEQQDKKN